MTEVDCRIDLDRPDSDHSHWLEIYVNEDRVRAVKNDSMPVFNESTYRYTIGEDGLKFVSGDKSCSGAGRSRSTSPSDEIDRLIRDVVEV